MPGAARPLLSPLLRSRAVAPCPDSGTGFAEPREGGEPIFMKHAEAASSTLIGTSGAAGGRRRSARNRARGHPRVLSDAFILALDAARGHPFRLAGTRVCALFGRELKGEPFLGLWAAASRTIIADLIRSSKANGRHRCWRDRAEPRRRSPRSRTSLVAARLATAESRPCDRRAGAARNSRHGWVRARSAPSISEPPSPWRGAQTRMLPRFMARRSRRGLVVDDGGRS